MNSETIVVLRKRAEEAVADMPEGALKLKSFEVILGKLLDAADTSVGKILSPKESISKRVVVKNKGQEDRGEVPDSCPDRVLALREEGFFKTPRALNEIRDELQLHGWTYPITSLSGPVQRLVQKRELRRMLGSDEKRKSYTYVAP